MYINFDHIKFGDTTLHNNNFFTTFLLYFCHPKSCLRYYFICVLYIIYVHNFFIFDIFDNSYNFV